MTSMLLNEEFVAVFPSLVRRLGGMNKAAVLQAIHFAAQVHGTRIDGAIWTPMTASQIAVKTGLSVDASQRALTALVEMGVLKGRGAERGSRKLMWAVQHERLEAFRDIAESTSAESRSQIRDIAECTTTKNIKEELNNYTSGVIESASTVVKSFIDKFRLLHDAEPEINSTKRLARDAKRMLADGRPMNLLVASAEHCASKGHANLSASVTYLLASGDPEPKGFTGIRRFLELESNE